MACRWVGLAIWVGIGSLLGCSAETTGPSDELLDEVAGQDEITGDDDAAEGESEDMTMPSGGLEGIDNPDEREAPPPPPPPEMNPEELDEGEECSSESVQAEDVVVEVEEEVQIETTREVPVNIYLMLDRSGSMDDQLQLSDEGFCPQSILNPMCDIPCFSGFEPWCCSTACGVQPDGQMDTASKWDMAVGAVNTFVQDMNSAGLNVALQYFPTDSGLCDGTGYDTPAVMMGTLPDHAMMVADSLMATVPAPQTTPNTPTEGALLGATRFCAEQQAQNPDERCVVVLVTDGVPQGGCNNDPARMNSIVSDAAMGDDVLTFAVGMDGADMNQLNMIADAAGTDCDPDTDDSACNASTSPDALLTALNNIREVVTEVETVIETHTEVHKETLPCEWAIPDPPEGETFDRDKVNVTFTIDGTDGELGRVPAQSDCGSHDNAWHYDNPDDPSTIVACPNTCERIEASTGSRQIDILLGCATEEIVPD